MRARLRSDLDVSDREDGRARRVIDAAAPHVRAWLSRRSGDHPSRHAIAAAVLLHAGAILGTGLWADSTPPPVPAAAQVTLVSGAAAEGQAPPGDTPDLNKVLANLTSQRPAPPAPSAAPTAHPVRGPLDDLLGQAPDPASRSRAASDAAASDTPLSQPAGGEASANRPNGSATPMTGVGRGETLAAVDSYATASLPPVGQRPAPPAKGDIWRQVLPCWRQISPAPSTIVVEIDRAGQIVGQPLSVHRSTPKPEELLADRSAVRALQACAPYSGLAESRWRLNFPGR